MLLYIVPNVYAAHDITTGCNEIFGSTTISIDSRLANIVHIVILVIQIAVPVVLVIFGMLDLFKSIAAQKEEEIQKGRKIFVKRLLSAGLVFFVVAIVKLVVRFAADKDDGLKIINCASCFLNGVNEENGVCEGVEAVDADGN